MTVCYCKRDIDEHAMRIELDVTVTWDAGDLRHSPDPQTKTYVFCSFACVAEWATDRSAAHDGNIVTEGVT